MNRYESLGYLVSHLNVTLQHELDKQLKRYQLDIKLWPILFALWQEEGMTQTQLSKQCDMANYTMTRCLDLLQSRGLISRHQEADNRRAFQIFLTDEAKALEYDIIREVDRIQERYFANFSVEEQEYFMMLLNKINRFILLPENVNDTEDKK